MNFYKIIMIPILVLGITGCYTQLGITQSNTLSGTDEIKKSTSAEENNSKVDTVVVIPANKHCIWQRNYWGEWNLNCYNSINDMYGYTFNHYPWWYDEWYGRINCDCPFNSYFMCQEYCEKHFGFIENKETENNGSVSSTQKESTQNKIEAVAPGTGKRPPFKQVLIGPKPSKKRPTTYIPEGIDSSNINVKSKDSADSESPTETTNNDRPRLNINSENIRRMGRTR